MGQNQMNVKILDIVCIAVLCTILTLGLWPFHAPKNDVTWLREQNGLGLGKHGTVIGSGAFAMADSHRSELSGSLEIWLRPRRTWFGGTFLAFGTPDDPFRFSLHQSLSDLRLRAAIGSDQNRSSVETSTSRTCFAGNNRYSLRSFRAPAGRRFTSTAFWPGERPGFGSSRIGSQVELSSVIHLGRPIVGPASY